MNVSKIEKGTIVRSVFLLCALINQFLTAQGLSPIDAEGVANFVAFVWTAAAGAWAWWKDNDITRKARAKKDAIKKQNIEN